MVVFFIFFFLRKQSILSAVIHADFFPSLCRCCPLMLISVSDLNSNQFLTKQRKSKWKKYEACVKRRHMFSCYPDLLLSQSKDKHSTSKSKWFITFDDFHLSVKCPSWHMMNISCLYYLHLWPKNYLSSLSVFTIATPINSG